MHQAPVFRPFDVHFAVSDMLRSTPTTLSVVVQVNKLGMPLYTLAVVDRHGSGQPVIQGFVYREDVGHLATFLATAKKLCAEHSSAQLSTSVFMIDKDSAEIVALHGAFPNQRILLCRFHVVKAITEELHKMQFTSTDKDAIMNVS